MPLQEIYIYKDTKRRARVILTWFILRNVYMGNRDEYKVVALTNDFADSFSWNRGGSQEIRNYRGGRTAYSDRNPEKEPYSA